MRQLLRGVNKQIIEIKDTDSRYFERALLFVRPEFADMGPGQLEQEANKYLATVGRPPTAWTAAKGSRPGPGLSRKPVRSHAARLAMVRRRRRLIAVGGLGIVLTAAALLLVYFL
ncbi:MAG: hypothetical protein HFE86_08195 [Clostridiales bacterium]|nr:hypothetical protein [Clostridiales bacterium]